jgi:hypothetical protein
LPPPGQAEELNRTLTFLQLIIRTTMAVPLRITLALAVALSASACDLLSEPDSWLQASITAPDESAEFIGNGFFDLSSPHPHTPRTFSLTAREGGVLGDDFQFVIAASSIPAAGTYPVIPMTDPASDAGFAAVYVQHLPTSSRAFAAEGGHVEIHSSSRGLVTGSFEFTAVRYCEVTDRPPSQEGPCIPTEAPYGEEEAPRVSITGAFSVVSGGSVASIQ